MTSMVAGSQVSPSSRYMTQDAQHFKCSQQMRGSPPTTESLPLGLYHPDNSAGRYIHNHEKLHQGVKPLVHHRIYESGATWGYGRKLPRAKALRRHSNPESGRICVRQVVDEEAATTIEVYLKVHGQTQVATRSSPVQAHTTANYDYALPVALPQEHPGLAGSGSPSLYQGPPPNEETYSVSSVPAAFSPASIYDQPPSEVSRSASPCPKSLAKYRYKNTDGSWSCSWSGCTSHSRFTRACILRKRRKQHSRPLS